jgi:hypothetical protein
MLAGRAERARKFVIENRSKLAQLVDDALAGKLQPRAFPEGAKLGYANGEAIGYVQSEHVYVADARRSMYQRREGLVPFSSTDPPRISHLPVVDPFAPEPERSTCSSTRSPTRAGSHISHDTETMTDTITCGGGVSVSSMSIRLAVCEPEVGQMEQP